MSSPIFTNNAIKKTKNYGLSEKKIIEVFNKGETERWRDFNVSIKKYSGYELRVFWKRTSDGKYLIVSVNKRERR